MMMGNGMMLSMLFSIILIGFAIYQFILIIMKPFEKNKSKECSYYFNRTLCMYRG